MIDGPQQRRFELCSTGHVVKLYFSLLLIRSIYLKEATDLIQIAGIVFVLAGVWFISQTDHVTQSKEREASWPKTAIGVLLVVIWALLEGVAQVFLKNLFWELSVGIFGFHSAL